MDGAAGNDDYEFYPGGVDGHAQDHRHLDVASVDAPWVRQYLEWSESETPVARPPATVLDVRHHSYDDPSFALATFRIDRAYLPLPIGERMKQYGVPHA